MINSQLRILMTLLLLATVGQAYSSNSGGRIIDGIMITPQEEKQLEPVCKLILFEQPDVHLNQTRSDAVALFSRPEYDMAKDADFLHHRCWALVSRSRYLRAKTNRERARFLSAFVDDMKYVINAAIRQKGPDGWKYLPLVRVELAELYLYEKQYAKVITECGAAINQDRSYVKAYTLLADTYAEMGSKAKSLDIVSEGLRWAPTSNPLQRRYKELGGKLPYPSTSIEDALPEPTPARQIGEKTSPTDTTGNSQVPEPSIPSANPQVTVQPVPSETGKIGNEKNKYCRFCP